MFGFNMPGTCIGEGTGCHDGRHKHVQVPAVLCGYGGERLSGYIDVLVVLCRALVYG